MEHIVTDINKKLHIEGAIFDLDGTLLNSTHVWEDFGNRFFDGTGITPRPTLRDDIRSLTLRQAAEYCIKEYDIKKSPEELMDHINENLRSFYAEEVELKKGVAAFLHFLHEKGIPMCVATATDRRLSESALKRYGLLDYMSDIVTCTDTGLSKNTPAIFEYAREKMGSPAKEHTFVFEDAFHAIKTARGGGYGVVGVYDVSEERNRAEIERLSDLYIMDFEGLERFFD